MEISTFSDDENMKLFIMKMIMTVIMTMIMIMIMMITIR